MAVIYKPFFIGDRILGLLSKFRKTEKKIDTNQEIFEHVCDLLNTKRSLGTYPLDYGMDSYIYLGSNEKVVMQVMCDIKELLTKYEPRVDQVEIQHLPGPNCFFLSFLIKFKILKASYSAQLSFNGANKHFNFEVDP